MCLDKPNLWPSPTTQIFSRQGGHLSNLKGGYKIHTIKHWLARDLTYILWLQIWMYVFCLLKKTSNWIEQSCLNRYLFTYKNKFFSKSNFSFINMEVLKDIYKKVSLNISVNLQKVCKYKQNWIVEGRGEVSNLLDLLFIFFSLPWKKIKYFFIFDLQPKGARKKTCMRITEAPTMAFIPPRC